MQKQKIYSATFKLNDFGNMKICLQNIPKSIATPPPILAYLFV